MSKVKKSGFFYISIDDLVDNNTHWAAIAGRPFKFFDSQKKLQSQFSRQGRRSESRGAAAVLFASLFYEQSTSFFVEKEVLHSATRAVLCHQRQKNQSLHFLHWVMQFLDPCPCHNPAIRTALLKVLFSKELKISLEFNQLFQTNKAEL